MEYDQPSLVRKLVASLFIFQFKELILIPFPAVPVEVVTNPELAVQLVGSNATFNCAASGTQPLIFMWYKDRESTPLETGGSVSINNQLLNESSLILTNIAPSDAGAYYCVASNILVAGIFMSNSTFANLPVQGKNILSY